MVDIKAVEAAIDCITIILFAFVLSAFQFSRVTYFSIMLYTDPLTPFIDVTIQPGSSQGLHTVSLHPSHTQTNRYQTIFYRCTMDESVPDSYRVVQPNVTANEVINTRNTLSH